MHFLGGELSTSPNRTEPWNKPGNLTPVNSGLGCFTAWMTISSVTITSLIFLALH